MNNPTTLRLILGDQLNSKHSWFSKVDDEVLYVLMEIRTETDYVKHHVQKVVGIFSAMRNFAKELEASGHSVSYISINDGNNLHAFDKNCARLINDLKIKNFEYLLPDEYRVDEHLKAFTSTLNINYKAYDAEHFYSSRTELQELFSGKKTYLMETFYRYMRKKHKVLIDADEKPLHGQWNFDEDNRKKLPKAHKPFPPLVFSNDCSGIEQVITDAKINTIGTVNSKDFIWPVNRKQSLALLDFFTNNCLKYFGTYQDAMAPEEWSIYHSRLSFSMNTKMISPQEVVNKAIEYSFNHPEEIQYNQLEGFVRQIIGWREYMRGIYWAKMPEYATLNFFEHKNTLPKWFWTGDTKMHCMKQAITQSISYSYAHHIQRLMITGNFALLAGVHPDEIDLWYLGIYIDAFEWVEITNTRGMSQYADGGIVGSKPYVSSATYINKMSNYCGDCHYKHTEKTGSSSCPFNSLYWNFYHQHENKLFKNPRIGMMYKVWDKMQSEQKEALLKRAEWCLANVDDL